jgi:hypothetical protein
VHDPQDVCDEKGRMLDEAGADVEELQLLPPLVLCKVSKRATIQATP